MTDAGGGRRAATRRPGPAREVPARADGVQLLGEVQGSGYRRPPALARREDGQVVQLTPLLHQVLVAVDGRRTVAEVAEAVSDASGRLVRPDDVRQLLDALAAPARAAARADGTEPELRRSDPLLALRFRRVVTDPAVTRRLTTPFAVALPPARRRAGRARLRRRRRLGAVLARGWPRRRPRRSATRRCSSPSSA